MKKILFAVVGTLLLAGAGCSNYVGNKALERASGGRVDVNGQKMKVTSDSGSLEWGGNKLPSDWPSDAPAYPGATVQFSANSNPTDKGQNKSSSVMLESKDSALLVSDFYKKELVSKGWKIAGTYEVGGVYSMTAEKDTRTLVLSIAGSKNSTSISLTIGSK